MAKFQHHSRFPNASAAQQYRFPHVCCACRKAFKYPANASGRICPQCKQPLERLSRKFHAPRSKDIAQWKKIELLLRHGFRFHPVYRQVTGSIKVAVAYPATLEEAKSFVALYQP